MSVERPRERVTIFCLTCDRSQALVEYGFAPGRTAFGIDAAVVTDVVALAPHCGCPRRPLSRTSVLVLGGKRDASVWRAAGVWWRLPRGEAA